MGQLFFEVQKLILPDKIAFEIRSNSKAIDLCKAGIYANWMEVIVFGPLAVTSGRLAEEYIGTDAGAKDSGTDTAIKTATAKSFFEQQMFFWKGAFYTRADALKWHANALGGVHFDFKKTITEGHIAEIKNYLGFEIKNEGKNFQMLIGNEIEAARGDTQRRPMVYDAIELIAIDTAVTFAKGIRKAEPAFRTLLT